MNNPEYILTDVFAEIVASVKAALGIDVLNYQFGYIASLNETLQQWNKVQDFQKLKFPCLWLQQPFTIVRSQDPRTYGRTQNLKVFIMTTSNIAQKPEQHMNEVFKPILYPIYRELLNQINHHPAFSVQSGLQIPHVKTDRYWWGEAQQNEIADVVDVIEIADLQLMINHNPNCSTFSNL